jgi:hypothetical protein
MHVRSARCGLPRSEATLTFPLTIVLRYSQLEPKERRLAQAVNDYTQWFLSRLRHLTERCKTANGYVPDASRWPTQVQPGDLGVLAARLREAGVRGCAGSSEALSRATSDLPG